MNYNLSLVFTFLGAFMQNPVTADFLEERGSVKVSFTVSERIDSITVSASVSFSAKGLQQLRPDGYVTVNGVSMPVKRLKQGYWYQLDIPKADRYELSVRRAKNSPEARFVLLPRRFVPQISPKISRTFGVAIQYEGPPISENERLFVKLGSTESTAPSEKWGVVLRPTIEANIITIPATAFRMVKSGKAMLYIGLSSFQQQVGSSNELTYAVGMERTVNVID